MVKTRLSKDVKVFWLLTGCCLVVIAALVLPGLLLQGSRTPSERPACTSLKTIAMAQEDFRANDRDRDGRKQFWRADITGLYALRPKTDPQGIAIKLIELSVASADDRPSEDITPYAVPSPKAGYWFRAIRHADETPGALDPNRFACCAYPDSPSAGKYLYVLDENNCIYRTPASGRRGIDVFPTEAELKEKWAKLD